MKYLISERYHGGQLSYYTVPRLMPYIDLSVCNLYHLSVILVLLE